MERICVIKDIYKALYRFERDFADEHGITINEAMVLCALREGETRTAGALSEYVGLSNSRVSKEIAPHDKRQMVFSLTDEGRAKIEGTMASGLPCKALFDALRRSMEQA